MDEQTKEQVKSVKKYRVYDLRERNDMKKNLSVEYVERQ